MGQAALAPASAVPIGFAAAFLGESIAILEQVDVAAIERMAAGLAQVRELGGRLFILGVGGSAGHAGHAVNDFRKLCGFEAYAPTDNVSELTARANDEGWDTCFAAWLQGSRIGPRDGVLVFSVGGGSREKNVSVNIVRALETASTAGAHIFGIVGRNGGFTRQIAEECIDATGRITIFDDGAGPEKTETQSRGIVLDVDESRRTVEPARAYQHPQPLLAGSMGNVQLLPDGHVLVGWGAQRYVSEFSAQGKLLADARLPPGLLSYRAFRSPWRGIPRDAPALVSRRDSDSDPPVLYTSWNGATEVAHWAVEVGPSADGLRPFGIARRLGFETGIPLAISEGYAKVSAARLGGRHAGDQRGDPDLSGLGVTRPVDRRRGGEVLGRS